MFSFFSPSVTPSAQDQMLELAFKLREGKHPQTLPFPSRPFAVSRTRSLQRSRLINNIASTLSLDKWSHDDLLEGIQQKNGMAVNFLCMHPDKEQNKTKKPDSTPDISVAGEILYRFASSGLLAHPCCFAPFCEARYQEIFVDLVAMNASLETRHSKYVLDPRFKSMLSDDDKAFKKDLLHFIQGLSEESRRSNAWQAVSLMLKDIGYDEKYSDRDSYIKSLERSRKLANKGSPSPAPSIPCLQKSSPCSSMSQSSSQANPELTSTPTPGHVFIANNSVCDVYCDAFLIPCDIGRSRVGRVPAGTIHTQWRQRLRKEDRPTYKDIMKTDSRADLVWNNSSNLVAFFKHWPFDKNKADPREALPMPVLGEIELVPRQQFPLPSMI